MTDTPAAANRHRLLLAFGLFVLAPLVGEFLLGNQPITALPGLVMFAPLYGGGALLIRETARRAGRGRPTMILLAAAYALVEEGPVDQMLWNPHYGGFDIGAAYSATYVPLLGTSVQMIQDVLALHTVWSICVPIALLEAFDRDRTRPWLGGFGLTVTAVVFGAGAALLGLGQAQSEKFVASAGQFAWAGAAIVALIVAAFLAGRRPAFPADSAPPAPAPRTVGLTAFALSSGYWSRDFLPGEGVSAWVLVGFWCVLAAVAVVVLGRWAHRPGWGDRHRFALAGGALLTYAWVGFEHGAQMGLPLTLSVPGSLVFATGAVLLLVAASRALRRREAAPTASLGAARPLPTR
ncbi:hypothetical protein [Streptomyces sp. VRA16 Mangrove soil]|uniref:hypothetical protein n=1 Tax=Streptomyces sp. VRA16 Mangrove soil TaxID=2817434 RepID=UPI001A9E40B7|nr:hypothetical protein [Streptomyces sp. VRA16 Mangrove soil]MBO1331253.1 hypothetical protein [Streptomyces sp. VRA16 Mangrove soil]